jgi:SAM-dependent methyltransferase
VLEIGCGTGGNLIPLAERFPDSRFVGFDLSGRHIIEAQRRIAELGFNNITFEHSDVRDFSCKDGEFDFILCHGVYSWVPTDVQKQILTLVQKALSARGVAYVSYNVRPGWYQRGVVRDILSFGGALSSSAHGEARVHKALEFLRLVAASRSDERDLYGTYLKEACERLQHSDPSYIAHEYLEVSNNPCTFSEFNDQAKSAGLQFLSESRPVFSSLNDIAPQAQAFVNELGDDVVQREQALDLLRNRAFRETLLCHSQQVIKRDLRASALRGVIAVSDYTHVGRDAARDFLFQEIVTGREIVLPAGLHAEVLSVVASGFSAGMIVERVLDQVGAPERDVLAAVAMLWTSGFITLEQLPIPAASSLEGAPRLSRVARMQLERNEPLCTLRHQALGATPAELTLLKEIDGSKKLAEIIAASAEPEKTQSLIVAMIERGALTAQSAA